MQANAWRYGFVMTYPKGQSADHCYDYEPWHYRYVGRDLAAALRGSGMTLREAIWAAYGP
jgi:D-alanyl-D-alanine carboxypeptidase